jgi:hypothetical protein
LAQSAPQDVLLFLDNYISGHVSQIKASTNPVPKSVLYTFNFLAKNFGGSPKNVKEGSDNLGDIQGNVRYIGNSRHTDISELSIAAFDKNFDKLLADCNSKRNLRPLTDYLRIRVDVPFLSTNRFVCTLFALINSVVEIQRK